MSDPSRELCSCPLGGGGSRALQRWPGELGGCWWDAQGGGCWGQRWSSWRRRARTACEGSLLSSWSRSELQELFNLLLWNWDAQMRAHPRAAAGGVLCCLWGCWLLPTFAARVLAPVAQVQSRFRGDRAICNCCSCSQVLCRSSSQPAPCCRTGPRVSHSGGGCRRTKRGW